MPKPTRAQLEKINRMTAEELTEDEVYVFSPLMIDDQETAYSSILHTNLLKKFVKDAKRGTPLLMNHNSYQLPVGRSFDSKLVNEHDDELDIDTNSVYGEFYIDLGRNTESNMTTDDIVKGIKSGTIFDVSVGFNAKTWKCSICGHDIRNYMKCPHFPGRTYEIEDDDRTIRNVKCTVIVGEDGEGELLELSLVYAGACDRATIKNFSNESVRELDKGAKLSVVDDFKNIPLNATIYQYYTKDGSVLFTDTDERTDGADYLNKRSEEKVNLEKLLEIFKATFGVDIENETQLSEKLTEITGELTKVKEELSAKESELETTKNELATSTVELETVKEDLSKKDETITELEKANEELASKAEVADTYRSDLINETIELGIKANGNSFQKELFTKFLETLSLEEIKSARDGFKQDVDTKFAGARVSEGDNSLEDRLSKNDTEVPDKDDEIEFRNFVAEKAMEYAKENKVSIGEATKLMFKKYSEDRSE